MTKNLYIQPRVEITEMAMVQTLCTSGGGSGVGERFSPLDPEATTDTQV